MVLSCFVHVLSMFSHWQIVRLLALWIAVRLGSGVDFFQLSEKLSNTALIPSYRGGMEVLSWDHVPAHVSGNGMIMGYRWRCPVCHGGRKKITHFKMQYPEMLDLTMKNIPGPSKYPETISW